MVLRPRLCDLELGWNEDRAHQLLLQRVECRELSMTRAWQSYPTGSSAIVECLIDSSSFGSLPFTGTIYQPHPCGLTAGGHHFRIRQQSGSFFFLSFDVQRV